LDKILTKERKTQLKEADEIRLPHQSLSQIR
jgi:hypothetical protein